VDAREIYSRLGSEGSRMALAEELLDILLTTYNHSVVTPELGREIVQRFISRDLGSAETLRLLLGLCMRAEPEKTSTLLRSRGLLARP